MLELVTIQYLCILPTVSLQGVKSFYQIDLFQIKLEGFEFSYMLQIIDRMGETKKKISEKSRHCDRKKSLNTYY